MDVQPEIDLPPYSPGGGGNGVLQMIVQQLREMRTEQRQAFDSVRSEFNQRLDNLVTNGAFAAEQRRVDERNSNLGRELGSERTAREKGDEALERRIDKLTSNMRWIAASLVIPVALFVGNIILIRGG